MNEWVVTYLGETVDAAFTYEDALQIREDLVDDIMADRLPDFLTSEDFDSRADCLNSFQLTELQD